MSKLIEMGKKYRTRDGRITRILAIDLNHTEYPVCAAIFTNGEERPSGFTAEGLYINDAKEKSVLDLIEYSPWSEVECGAPCWVRDQEKCSWRIAMFSQLMANGTPLFQCAIGGDASAYRYSSITRPLHND